MQITFVTTSLNVNRESPNYNAAAMIELTKHVEAWQADRGEDVLIFDFGIRRNRC